MIDIDKEGNIVETSIREEKIKCKSYAAVTTEILESFDEKKSEIYSKLFVGVEPVKDNVEMETTYGTAPTITSTDRCNISDFYIGRAQNDIYLVNFSGTITMDGLPFGRSPETFKANNNLQEAIVVALPTYGEGQQLFSNVKSTKNVSLSGITETEDGNYLVYGSFDGTVTVGSDTATSKGGYDIMMAKFDTSGNYIANSLFTFGGTQDDVVSSVKATKDGGLLVGGYHYSTTVDIDGDGVNDITQVNKSTTATQYYSDGFVVKFDGQDLSDTATFSFVDQIAGTGFEEVTSVAEMTNSKNEPVYVATGCFDSPTVDAAQEEGVFTSKVNTD